MTYDRRKLLKRLAWLLLLGAVQPAQAANPDAISEANSPEWNALKLHLRKRYPGVPRISVMTLRVWRQDATRPAPLLFDTRPAEEFDDGHIEGAVRLDSLDAALQLLRERPPGTAAVFYCSVGYRSSVMVDALQAKGVTLIYNLEGSLFEWANAGHDVIASDGRHGKVHPYDRKWGVLLRRDLWSREP